MAMNPSQQARTSLTETELRKLAARGAAELDGAGATELLRWTDETFGDSYVVAR